MPAQIINIENYTDSQVIKIYDNIPVIIPTETVYGISASIYNINSLQNIFHLKGRPQDNPLIVHVSSIEMLRNIVEFIPEAYNVLIEKFWPGPLTLLFKPRDVINKIITCNSEYVAIRMPSHPVALRIINAVGPLAAPSANLSGRPSPITAEHAFEDMKDNVNYIIDGGMCNVGVESTILLIKDDNINILRPGGIIEEEIKEILTDFSFKNKENNKNNIIVPGSKYKHYAPRIPVEIFDKEDIENSIKNSLYTKIGVILIKENIENEKNINFKFSIENTKEVLRINLKNKKELQNKIFYLLRELEKICEVIFVEKVNKKNEGLAIMDRIERAAKH